MRIAQRRMYEDVKGERRGDGYGGRRAFVILLKRSIIRLYDPRKLPTRVF